jgi:hypothetical protein
LELALVRPGGRTRRRATAARDSDPVDKLAPLIEAVEARFAEAADTLRRLPREDLRFLGDVVSSWPPVLYEKADWWVGGGPDVRLRRSPATRRAIDQLDEVLDWLFWLTPDERWVIMARAAGASWRRMARWRRPGQVRSHEGLRRIHRDAMTRVTLRLLAGAGREIPD